MIERYTRKPMKDLWSEETKFNTFLEIELLNAEFLFESGIASANELALLKANSKVDIPRIHELENEIKHDVMAFTRTVSETLGKEKRFIHYGLTSTDIVDTANAVILKKANKIILHDIEVFLSILKDKADLYKDTLCIGRTHGIHAEITVFGLKWALWYDEMKRNLVRFNNSRQKSKPEKSVEQLETMHLLILQLRLIFAINWALTNRTFPRRLCKETDMHIIYPFWR